MRKKRITFLCGIIVIMLIITIILICSTIKPKQTNTANVVNIFKNEIKTVDEKTVIPQNSYMFFGKYINGCMDSKTIYEKISNYYSNIIPSYYLKLNSKNDDQIKKYYSENEENVKRELEVKSIEEFKSIVNILDKLTGDNIELEYLEFAENDIQQYKDCTVAKMKVKYKNNNEFYMYIKAYLSNQENSENLEIYVDK